MEIKTVKSTCVFEDVKDKKNFTGKLVTEDGQLTEIKLYDGIRLVRTLKYSNLNEDPDNTEITYKQFT